MALSGFVFPQLICLLQVVPGNLQEQKGSKGFVIVSGETSQDPILLKMKDKYHKARLFFIFARGNTDKSMPN